MTIQNAYQIICKDGTSAFVPSSELLGKDFSQDQISESRNVFLLLADDGKILQKKDDQNVISYSAIIYDETEQIDYIEVDPPTYDDIEDTDIVE